MAFSFGNKTPQAFGAQPSGSITFGTPVAQSTGQFGLGTSTLSQTPSGGFQLHAATPQTNLLGSTAPTLNFNVTSTAAGQPLGFGAPVSTASTGLSFGATTSAPPTGLAFGTPASAPSTGLTFGATPAATTSTGLTFGAPATTATGFGLGTPATTAGLTFGTQTTQSTGLFGSTPSTGLSFGAPASSATTTPSFGLGLGTTTTTASGLAFGATPTTTSTGLGFGLGASTGLFGLGGTPAKTSTVTTTVNVTPQNVGLGGITTQQKEPTTTKTELIPKDQPLPNELLQTVENFKNFVKEQKACSSEVSRCSVKDFRSVESEINNINKLLKEVEIELQRNRSIAQKLKFDTAKGLQSADIAQRTFNTPPGLQYNNVAPLNFFLDLADGFEKKIQEMKMQIENMSCYVRNLNRVGNVGSQDLALGMRRLHETFVALAGRLQSLHSQVELQKEEYLRFRKNILHDTTNVFEMPNSHNEALNIAINSLRYSPPMLASGPTPFNNVTATSFALLENQNQPSAYPGSTLSGNLIATSSTTTQGATTPFVAINTGLSSGSGFQLQNPPIGGKRGRP